MTNSLLMQNPFAVMTFIVAPAVLTNATSVLAMSTTTRMLRTRERMHQLFEESERGTIAHETRFIGQVNRVERQALLLLNALHWIYVAIGAFAATTLVTLLGAFAGQLDDELLLRIITGAALLLGFIGVSGMIGGCLNLFHATRLSLVNIREEAELIRARQKHSVSSADLV